MILIRVPLPKNIEGAAMFPFIFLSSQKYSSMDEVPKRLINHERIHIRQQLEMVILLFALWYNIEHIIKWIKYRDRSKGYRNISFEREAYENQYNLEYLNQRKWCAWRYYL